MIVWQGEKCQALYYRSRRLLSSVRIPHSVHQTLSSLMAVCYHPHPSWTSLNVELYNILKSGVLRITLDDILQGINRLGKAPPRPGSLRPPDPNRNKTLDVFSEGTEGDADYMRMVQDVSIALQNNLYAVIHRTRSHTHAKLKDSWGP